MKTLELDLASEEREEEFVRFDHHGVWVPPRLIRGLWINDGMIPAAMDPGDQIGEELKPLFAIAGIAMIIVAFAIVAISPLF